VDITIFVDNKKKFPDKVDSTDHSITEESNPTMDWIKLNVHWPHGELRLHKREKNAGLKRSIMEAWYPVNDHTFGAFFEDDTEASPLWYVWVAQALERYYFVPNRPDRLIGLSLYRAVFDEMNARTLVVDNSHKPFAFQQPCSWGAVYFPGAWRYFRDWFSNVNYDPKVPWGTPSNNWFWWDSWKKFLIRLMWDHGLFMIHPNLPDKMVLSTNHLMKGMHNLPPRDLFELPLLTQQKREEFASQGQDVLEVPALDQLVCLDMKLNKVASWEMFPGANSAYKLPVFSTVE
jgi:hypothetical protein